MAKSVVDKLDETLGIAKKVLADSALIPEELIEMQEVSKDLQTMPSEESSFVRIPRIQPTEEVTSYETDLENDYHYSRGVLKRLVMNAEMTLDALLCVAQDSQHPRAYEVAAALMKSIQEATKELIALQKTMREMKQENSNLNVENAENVTTNNFVFNGTTAELQDLIRKQIGRT